MGFLARHRTSLQLFAAFFALYAMTASGGYEVVDAAVRYETAKSWLLGRGGDLTGVVVDTPQGLAVHGRGDHLFAVYGPLQSVLMLPCAAVARLVSQAHADALAKLLFMLVVFPGLAALGLVILRRTLLDAGFTAKQALGGAVIVGLCTPYWHYARSGQEENLVAFAFVLYLFGYVGIARGRRAGVWWVAAGLSTAIATRWSIGLVLAVLGCAALLELYRQREAARAWRRTLVGAAVLLAVVVALLLAYNAWRFEAPLDTGYGRWFRRNDLALFEPTSLPAHAAALLVSPYRGILFFSPAIALVGLGFARLSEQTSMVRRLLWVGAIANVVNLAFVSSLHIWDAGFAWGPRYLVSVSVLLAPALVVGASRTRAAAPVLALSGVVQLMSVVLPSSTENFVYAERRDCTPWTCECTATCLRPPAAARALANALLARPFPSTAGEGPQSASVAQALASSDYNAAYFWPVRAAYSTRRFSPALGLLASLAGMAFAAWQLLRLRRLSSEPEPERDAAATAEQAG